ncbi:hypothetical protein BYT27DRAFT_7206329 [Phlegmacium glaucopus]|nr:hypothetical protein BYT27DRAFT_7206329 [Phlegmacium glaucopus]
MALGNFLIGLSGVSHGLSQGQAKAKVKPSFDPKPWLEPGQAKAKPRPRVWPWPGKSEAKAKPAHHYSLRIWVQIHRGNGRNFAIISFLSIMPGVSGLVVGFDAVKKSLWVVHNRAIAAVFFELKSLVYPIAASGISVSD